MAKGLIARNPKIQFGAYTIRGTRITVTFVQGRHLAGDSARQMAKEYGQPLRVIQAAINFRRG